MPTTPTVSIHSVKSKIIQILKEQSFDHAMEREEFLELLRQDAQSSSPLFTQDSLDAFAEARDLRAASKSQPQLGAFVSNKSVMIVPGFMGSQLRDDGPANANGLIWIDPKIYVTPSQLSALRLASYDPAQGDVDATPGVHIREDGAVPILYAGLKYYLESGRCEVRTAGFDWRRDIDESANQLMRRIQDYANEFPRRPFFLIAHSQGSLVARRALQIMGKETARSLVNRLILIGPASYGTFSAAFALGGSHPMLKDLAGYGMRWPADLNDVLQSMSGLYQLLPWKPGSIDMSPGELAKPGFWKNGIDPQRLSEFFAWGKSIDTGFFNDRTTIILGNSSKNPDGRETPSAVAFNADGELVATSWSTGDGTVPDDCAIVEGVTDLARCAPGSDHMTLPIQRRVMQMVWRIINANVNVRSLHSTAELMRLDGADDGARTRPVAGDAGAPGRDSRPIADLPDPVDLRRLAGLPVPDKRVKSPPPGPKPAAVPPPPPPGGTSSSAPRVRSDHYSHVPPAPPHRRLRVYSFDPLLATDPESLGMESIVLRLEWDEESADGAKLQPGPVGEYLEVVDYDPASGCFYPPVDLNHPNLLAQDGMPLNESDPRFHQQMVYAVCMATITIFERALGRTVLWSPHLPRRADGSVDPQQLRRRPGGEFVRRLRIYPHAMREPNAYYDPQRKALLFGYFPARTEAGSRVLPGGLVFTCLSYDVVAHETTHALLDGMHRHLIEASNPDVLAFHEAFADIVALFQHFSHPEVLNRQVALAAGKLQNETLLGQLAQQFGEAMGMHKSLRNYLGELEAVPGGEPRWQPKKPDPALYRSKTEPHELGAILVAAMFTAFLTIYRNRTRDLMRIASGGSGVAPPGDLHPDLVNRLAGEAAKTAGHLLIMAIRALDYVPPVDLNFGDYLRAIITGDSDLVSEDSRFYRVAIVDAFRQWGIYPRFVRNLSVESLNWAPPEDASLRLEMELFREIMAVGSGNLRLDRGDLHELQRTFMVRMHRWMRELFEQSPQVAREWGLSVDDQTPRSIARDDGARGDGQGKKLPRFEVHSVRRCRRIGPDEQERIDVIVVVLQKRDGYLNPAHQAIADAGGQPPVRPDFVLRGGATLIVDPRAGRIRYAIRKSIVSDARLASAREFHSQSGSLGLRANYAGARADANPFPMLHAGD